MAKLRVFAARAPFLPRQPIKRSARARDPAALARKAKATMSSSMALARLHLAPTPTPVRGGL